MPSFNKYLRLSDKGIEISSENVSQSLRPESQSLCSVIAPMLWMCMNVFWSINKPITGFWLNLNNQFFYDKFSDKRHPEEPFVQVNGKLPYYKLFLRGVLFITAAATTKVFEYILILSFKFKKRELSETRIFFENRIGHLFDFRFCRACFYLIIRTIQGQWMWGFVESGCKRI